MAKRSRVRRRRWSDAALYLAFAFITLFFVFPVFWVFSMSLKSVPELFATPPIWFSTDPQWENYAFVLRNTPITGYLLNSAIIVFFTVLLTLAVAVCAAYGFSRFRFHFKKPSLMAILVFQMISPVVIAIPLYRFFVGLGLLNNYASLITVYVAAFLPFTVWFLKGYFDTIPYELDEAAIVDGCTRMQLLWRVLLPVSLPGIVSAGILVGVLSWSQFVIPFILLDDRDLYPVSVGLVNLRDSADAVTLHYLSAASIIAIAPVIAVFVLMQRYIVSALTAGAVKG
ncbi:carbohydrate ABC transporter permease [Rubrobacter taiwanensis]|uniref:Carbohydrate ABC transporter permease n=2 Tax=Rubrobacter taiwanensis TaxID=185139 RepID=A0A4R1BIF1_9ACTN|nr:carbohydrate ABC transporter permease [Rubrobacter taiwanensis]